MVDFVQDFSYAAFSYQAKDRPEIKRTKRMCRKGIMLLLICTASLAARTGSFAQVDEKKQVQKKKAESASAETGLVPAAVSGKPADTMLDEGFRLDISKLKDKHLWTLVNAQPFYISSELDGLCRSATLADFAFQRKQDPHSNTFISVFVNQVGREAMFSNPSRQFPKGTILVKKKFEPYSQNTTPLPAKFQRDAVSSPPLQPFPERIAFRDKFDPYSEDRSVILLYTVMIKRKPGYNPEVGDWEFAVVSGDGSKTEASGKLANCMGCHQSRRDSDFVFRSYINVVPATTSKH